VNIKPAVETFPERTFVNAVEGQVLFALIIPSLVVLKISSHYRLYIKKPINQNRKEV